MRSTQLPIFFCTLKKKEQLGDLNKLNRLLMGNAVLMDNISLHYCHLMHSEMVSFQSVLSNQGCSALLANKTLKSSIEIQTAGC